jgi:hypothetical protein
MSSSYSFTTLALGRGEWSVSGPGHTLPPGKGYPVPIGQEAGVGHRAGLDTEARGKTLLHLPGIEPWPPGRPVHIQTLYWLSYHGSHRLMLVQLLKILNVLLMTWKKKITWLWMMNYKGCRRHLSRPVLSCYTALNVHFECMLGLQ